ncbi:efflux RND transporter periplasmic adaptor subunit [Psychromonas aquimarina]|uniref:efflux RND transporter periplasmic adaptor subunit n=1 Tax=Psychromonas aquimarina TaxID=444919 RepID=UPI000405245D|nr:efflux RND transporter periplasmic adaptor subunit [Psychromonas aquimarina]
MAIFKNHQRLKLILISLLLFASAAAAVLIIEPQSAPVQPASQIYQPVTVVHATPGSFVPSVTLLGTTHARWLSEVKAQVSGDVVHLDKTLEPSSLVKKDQQLLALDTTHLTSRVAEAQSQIKQAELNLLREQHEQTVALKMLSKQNSSAYARKEPQIALAAAALEQAKQALKSTRKQLSDAAVSAPFDAMIIRRDVSPGQYVESGQSLFTLTSSDSIDVQVPVSESKWGLLSRGLSRPTIMVIDRQGREWPGLLRYIAPQADQKTRQRQIVLSVAGPYSSSPRLLPEQQVWVKITLDPQQNAVQVPGSALTRDGQIWIVDADNKLAVQSVELLEQGADSAWVTFIHDPEEARSIVQFPLASMLEGQRVSPQHHQEAVQ